MGSFDLCAVLDSGAEVSLVSSSVLSVAHGAGINFCVQEDKLCDIVGFSGKRIPITQTVQLSLVIGTLNMPEIHKFAVVDDNIFPHCFLLGLDFMSHYNLSIDFNALTFKQDGEVVSRLTPVSWRDIVGPCLFSVSAGSSEPHLKLNTQDLRFETQGNFPTVTGLSMLSDLETIRVLQSHSPELKCLYKQLKKQVPTQGWPKRIKAFARHSAKLSIQSGLIFYGDTSPTVVIPFESLVDVCVSLHFNLAHIGRDKLLDLIFELVWHPSRYRVAQDVCSTCHSCQILKEFSTTLIPPTLKICTSYPFELMAADLISLPRSPRGFIGCLVLVDHYSKWVTAVPIKNKTSETIVKAFHDQIFPSLIRIPTNILTDNGPEFTCTKFSEFLMQSNVNHKLTTPYCPTSNGAIERVNRTIKNFLRSLVSDEVPWDVALPKALIVYNHTWHSALQMSPSNFLLTRSHNTNCDPPLQGTLAEHWRHGHPKFVKFSVGQLVLMKCQHKGFLSTNKLSPTFRGPFKVNVANENGVTYELVDQNGVEHVRAHHSQLRAYKLPPKYLAEHPSFVLTVRDERGDDVMSGSRMHDIGEVESTVPLTSVSHSSMDSESSIGLSDTSSDPDSINFFGSDDDSSSLFSGFGNSLASSQPKMWSADAANSRLLDQSLQSSSLRSEVHGLCRGCHFEAAVEAESFCSVEIHDAHVCTAPEQVVIAAEDARGYIEQEQVVEPATDAHNCIGGVQVVDEANDETTEGITRLQQLYKLTMDWDDDDSEFSLASLNSLLVGDQSHEDIDPELAVADRKIQEIQGAEQNVSCETPAAGLESEELDDSDDEESNSPFTGFTQDPLPSARVSRLKKMTKQSGEPDITSQATVRHTRSKGSVQDLPNVQLVTLERKRNRRRCSS
ncbi:uncharacterized protein LOC125177792 [Hyalella azteca]|uniref:RNA-directed DNA polymerase n=1 Tax=Hyalella azteca TaxID=294128 RepID=A0A979FGV3_HYAAZ|nr:uncharacterized protein LOC125177792 [Hyalella azteca]